jgi:putative DNA primase/helicase
LAGLKGSDRDAMDIIKFIRSIQNGNRPKSILDFCKCLPGVSVSSDDFDANPMLIQLENCVINLKNTCVPFAGHSNDRVDPKVPEYLFDRKHLITKRCNVKYYEGKLEDSTWIRHLELIFNGDQELIEYMQKLCGYFLAGITDECIMPIAFGDGANGKSVFWNTINGIMGDYSGTASSELIMPTREPNMHLQAELYRKRAVFVGEPKAGRKIDDGKVKELTGDDVICCRRLYENPWEFKPTHTFFCSSNHKPVINTQDNGIWRRIKLIPFTVNVQEALKEKGGADPKFMEKLQTEWPGIFKWMLQGWKKYRNHGLDDCWAIKQATLEYRSEEDTFQMFIDEKLIAAEAHWITAGDLNRMLRNENLKIPKSRIQKTLESIPGVTYEKKLDDPRRNCMIFKGIGEPQSGFFSS